MKLGDLIEFTRPTDGKKIIGSLTEAPSASGPYQTGSTMTVIDTEGMPHRFDAWLIDWRIVADHGQGN